MKIDRDYVAWAWPSVLSLSSLLAISGSKLWLLSLLFLFFAIPLPRQVMAHRIAMPGSASITSLTRQIDLVIFPVVAAIAVVAWLSGASA